MCCSRKTFPLAIAIIISLALLMPQSWANPGYWRKEVDRGALTSRLPRPVMLPAERSWLNWRSEAKAVAKLEMQALCSRVSGALGQLTQASPILQRANTAKMARRTFTAIVKRRASEVPWAIKLDLEG